MGPAGSGKSTYCSTMVKHCENIRRPVHVVNLDPAAEYFDYPVDIDIRELVHLDDVMEADDLRLGPNGGLVFCMEYVAIVDESYVCVICHMYLYKHLRKHL
jgi:GTPase SAR1 family protein